MNSARIISIIAAAGSVATLAGTAHAAADVADLLGTFKDSYGAMQTIIVSLESDGSAYDTEGRSGTYELDVDALGDSVLTLDFGRQGIHVMNLSDSGCWEEPPPYINPGLVELAICIQSNAHRLVEYDMPTCGDPDDFPNVQPVAPLLAEDGHWYAGRLTTTYPNGYWVNDFSYFVFTDLGGTDCAAQDHTVQLFLGPANGLPPANPVVLFETDITAASLASGWDEVTIDLPQPILLPAGQSLFVSIEMPHAGTNFMCVADCTSNPSADLTFWSDAVAPAYSWYDLEPFGYGDVMVFADGIANN